MCIGKSAPKAETPAAAPAPALPPPDVPEVGDTRRQESKDLYGSDAPTYRVKRKATSQSVTPDSNIVM